jgi:hypothetical protein
MKYLILALLMGIGMMGCKQVTTIDVSKSIDTLGVKVNAMISRDSIMRADNDSLLSFIEKHDQLERLKRNERDTAILYLQNKISHHEYMIVWRKQRDYFRDVYLPAYYRRYPVDTLKNKP